MEQRIGTWILGSGGLNLKLVTFEERPDKAQWKDGPFYRIKDIFSTIAGSWQLEPGRKYSIDQWAVADYWQGAKWTSHGDHNFHIMILDDDGNPMASKGILFRQNDWLWQPENVHNSSFKGDADVVLANSYAPSRGELGSWIGTTVGRADALVGVDMPLNEHVTVYLVLQQDEEAPPDPDPDPEPGTGDLAGVVTAINGLTAQVKRLADHLGAA